MNNKEQVLHYLSQTVSYLFNPLIMPTVGLWIMLYYIPGTAIFGPRLRLILYGIVLITSCLLPLLFFLILKFNFGQGQQYKRNNERILSYFFTAFSIFLGAQLLAKLPLPSLFRIYLTGTSLILILLFFLSLKWKVSNHAAGIGLITGTALALTFRFGIDLSVPIIVSILVAGVVASSRIYLERQSLPGVLSGYLISCLFIYFTLLFV